MESECVCVLTDDDDDFIVDDFGQPIRRKKGDGTYTDP